MSGYFVSHIAYIQTRLTYVSCQIKTLGFRRLSTLEKGRITYLSHLTALLGEGKETETVWRLA